MCFVIYESKILRVNNVCRIKEASSMWSCMWSCLSSWNIQRMVSPLGWSIQWMGDSGKKAGQSYITKKGLKSLAKKIRMNTIGKSRRIPYLTLWSFRRGYYWNSLKPGDQEFFLWRPLRSYLNRWKDDKALGQERFSGNKEARTDGKSSGIVWEMLLCVTRTLYYYVLTLIGESFSDSPCQRAHMGAVSKATVILQVHVHLREH